MRLGHQNVEHSVFLGASKNTTNTYAPKCPKRCPKASTSYKRADLKCDPITTDEILPLHTMSLTRLPSRKNAIREVKFAGPTANGMLNTEQLNLLSLSPVLSYIANDNCPQPGALTGAHPGSWRGRLSPGPEPVLRPTSASRSPRLHRDAPALTGDAAPWER